jgi:ubiquinone/menaquinone biosynthesis C-methylase UbiE
MNRRDAIALLRAAAPAAGGTWADLGAGRGTFTLALAQLLGPSGQVYAVDHDRAALAELQARTPEEHAAHIAIVEADFTRPFHLPGIHRGALDGLLLANALHFVPDATRVFCQL